MNWRKAKDHQLREIAYLDEGASWVDKVAAEKELMRRYNPKKYHRINYKEKAVMSK